MLIDALRSAQTKLMWVHRVMVVALYFLTKFKVMYQVVQPSGSAECKYANCTSLEIRKFNTPA